MKGVLYPNGTNWLVWDYNKVGYDTEDAEEIQKIFDQCNCYAATYFPHTMSLNFELSQSNSLEKPKIHERPYAYFSKFEIRNDDLSIRFDSPYEICFNLEITVPLSKITEVQKVYDEKTQKIPDEILPVLGDYDVRGCLAEWSISRLFEEGKKRSSLMITSTVLRFEDLTHPNLQNLKHDWSTENKNLNEQQVSVINQLKKEYAAWIEIPWKILFEELEKIQLTSKPLTSKQKRKICHV